MTEFKFYTTFIGKINTALASYVQDTATNVIQEITPVTQTMVIIYVVLWGLLMMKGTISEPITDGLGRILKISIITGLVLGIGNYNGYITDFLWNSPEALASLMASGNAETASNTQFLDSFLSQFFDMFTKFKIAAIKNSTAYIPDLTMLLTGSVVMLVGMALTGYVAVLLIAAKMALAILLAAGPIFVLFTMFEATKKFFDAWIGQVLTCVFTVMLLAAALKLVIFFVSDYLTAAGSLVIDPDIDQAIPVIVMGGISIIVLRQIPAIASALGGGVAINTFGAVGWSYDKGKQASKDAFKLAKTTSQRVRKGASYLNQKRNQNTIKRK